MQSRNLTLSNDVNHICNCRDIRITSTMFFWTNNYPPPNSSVFAEACSASPGFVWKYAAPKCDALSSFFLPRRLYIIGCIHHFQTSISPWSFMSSCCWSKSKTYPTDIFHSQKIGELAIFHLASQRMEVPMPSQPRCCWWWNPPKYSKAPWWPCPAPAPKGGGRPHGAAHARGTRRAAHRSPRGPGWRHRPRRNVTAGVEISGKFGGNQVYDGICIYRYNDIMVMEY